jgi:hypothetical protein
VESNNSVFQVKMHVMGNGNELNTGSCLEGDELSLTRELEFGFPNQIVVKKIGKDNKIGHLKKGMEENFVSNLLQACIKYESFCISPSSRDYRSSFIDGFDILLVVN